MHHVTDGYVIEHPGVCATAGFALELRVGPAHDLRHDVDEAGRGPARSSSPAASST